jgi:hypothetical protein
MKSEFQSTHSLAIGSFPDRVEIRPELGIRDEHCSIWKLLILIGAIVLSFSGGCGTTTNRVATEQLLLSDAVDRAVAKIDFTHLAGQKVYLDTVYLHSVKGIGFVNSEYVISSLRQQLTAARCLVQDSREDAEIVVEPRVGALGTDGHEVVYGIPQSGAVNSAAKVLTNVPIASIPEISFGKNNAQSGIAKIIVFAYQRESREPVWQSGVARAESTSKDTWFLGAGPFQKGSIYEGVRFAGNKIEPTEPVLSSPQVDIEEEIHLPDTVRFDNAYSFLDDDHMSDLNVVPSAESEPATAKDKVYRLQDDFDVGQTNYSESADTDP